MPALAHQSSIKNHTRSYLLLVAPPTRTPAHQVAAIMMNGAGMRIIEGRHDSSSELTSPLTMKNIGRSKEAELSGAASRARLVVATSTTRSSSTQSSPRPRPRPRRSFSSSTGAEAAAAAAAAAEATGVVQFALHANSIHEVESRKDFSKEETSQLWYSRNDIKVLMKRVQMTVQMMRSGGSPSSSHFRSARGGGDRRKKGKHCGETEDATNITNQQDQQEPPVVLLEGGEEEEFSFRGIETECDQAKRKERLEQLRMAILWNPPPASSYDDDSDNEDQRLALLSQAITQTSRQEAVLRAKYDRQAALKAYRKMRSV